MLAFPQTTLLPKYDPRSSARHVCDWFTLTRNGERSRCQVRTNPRGSELRLTGDSSGAFHGFELLQVCHSELQVVHVAESWFKHLLARGWSLRTRVEQGSVQR